MPSIRRDILRKQLAWMPKVWLAALKAHRRAASYEIIGFELTSPDSLELPAEFQSLTGMEYFYASRGPANTDEGIHIHKPDLDPRLVKADLLANSCTNAVYTFWHIMHRILGIDPNFCGIHWMRRNPYPKFVTFDIDDVEKITACSHDFFLVAYQGNDRFVVDFTGAQFGWEEWLYTEKDYEKNLLPCTLDLKPIEAEEEILIYNDEEEGAVILIKEAIERCVEEAEAQVIAGEGADTVYEKLADRVGNAVLEALKRRKDSMEEGVESI
ncbi:hypothetical protein HBH70_082060 [Parastagonospora nodorum]|nr:hypothetical protein HBH53_055490 [Parastagonospora nodorum]KAH4045523.1 hypothetical protein HBH49_198710 [Parastagonospora nodorum]KAH4069507.1 hypothetical protein HBH50_099940 [Parastagonospora nodorum]KAH4089916.1 hypothetical protein HBH48_103720 [Parastagonospora nodorum]KAH4125212.1 hypothetical protein HBH47_065620 [Parastagonospora nodorum]